jgi:hypothetical protein
VKFQSEMEGKNNIFSFIKNAKEFFWLATSIITIGTLIATTAVNHYKAGQANKAVIDTLAKQSVQNGVILVWMRGIDKKITDMGTEFTTTKSNVNTLTGSYNVLDRSYVRTLEKTLKATEEASQYKDEKIQALQEALKKNN